MSAITPRQQARLDTLARIDAIAWQQLAEGGATGLSLRAIARELGVVSSGIYRYYRSRDDLITRLIVIAYGELAEALESAGAADRRTTRRRWLDVAGAFRGWALREPHRFALIYGSVIPDYRAPEETIAPAARVVRAFSAPGLAAARAESATMSRALRSQLRAFGSATEVPAEPAAQLRMAGAFARVVGLVALELGGHLVGTFEPADDLFTALLEEEATRLGL